MPHVVHHAIDVNATPAQVWQCFRDLSTWARWFPYAVGAHAEPPAGSSDGGAGSSSNGSSKPGEDDSLPWPWQPGGVIVVELEVPVRGRMPLRLEMIDVEPARRVRWRGGAYGIHAEHTYRFDDHQRWTRVTSHEEFSAGLLAGLAMRAVRSRVDDVTHQSLARLRAVVEQALAPPA